MSKLSKIVFNILIISFFGIYSFSLFNHPVYSNTVEELEEQIAEKEKEIKEKESVLESVEARIAEISNSNYSVSQKINLLTAEITSLEESIEKTEREIDEKVKGIEEKQEQLATMKELIDEVSGDLYMQSRYKLANFFLNKDNWSNIVETLFIKQSTISMLRREAEKIGGEFSSLAESKAELDKEKEDLDKERAGLDEAYKLLADERAKLQAELSREVATKTGLSTQIGGIRKELSQLQNYLMLIRSGGTVVNASSLVSTNSLGSYLNFLNVAPSGTFGVFSFGAFTHRNGMSQYGANARANSGQSYQDILSVYYPGSSLATGTVTEITVRFCDESPNNCRICKGQRDVTYDFETEYLYRLGEMPESFHMDALKAQAIAARTYALNATNYGRNPIRGDECGQVIAEQKTGTWKQAVDATTGVVLNKNGAVFSAQFAAVHGGWGNDVKWDTTDRKGDDVDWVSRAWENLSGSTSFYRNWFDYNTITGSYSACSSHPNPWLTQSEMADLLNAYKYLLKVESDDRLISVDFPICFKNVCVGGICGYNSNPYSVAELRSLIPNPVTSISKVVTLNSGGSTSKIIFYTDVGVLEVPAGDFKKVFSLRAPGHYSIPQKDFAHFNIVMK